MAMFIQIVIFIVLLLLFLGVISTITFAITSVFNVIFPEEKKPSITIELSWIDDEESVPPKKDKSVKR